MKINPWIQKKLKIFFFFVIIPATSWMFSYICYDINYIQDMKVIANIFFAWIFFSFAITLWSANKRRFDALEEIAKISSSLMFIWRLFKKFLPKKEAEKSLLELRLFFTFLKIIFEKNESKVFDQDLRKIDSNITKITNHVFSLREQWLDSSMVARVMQWLEQLNFSIEKMITIKEQNNSATLKKIIHYSLFTAILILSPEFASMWAVWILSSILITYVIMSLAYVQDMLEDPFWSKVDDINFDFEDRVQNRIKHWTEKIG